MSLCSTTKIMMRLLEEQQQKRMNINVEGSYLVVLGDSMQRVVIMIGAVVRMHLPLSLLCEWKLEPFC